MEYNEKAIDDLTLVTHRSSSLMREYRMRRKESNRRVKKSEGSRLALANFG